MILHNWTELRLTLESSEPLENLTFRLAVSTNLLDQLLEIAAADRQRGTRDCMQSHFSIFGDVSESGVGEWIAETITIVYLRPCGYFPFGPFFFLSLIN